MSRRLSTQLFCPFSIWLRPILVLVLAAVALTLQPAPVAHAVTINWKAAVSGNWNDLTKWSTGTVPSASDDVVIDATGADYTISITDNGSFAHFPGRLSQLGRGDASGVPAEQHKCVGGVTRGPI